MLPSMRDFGTSSCMRFRQRRKVDFPQPLGPMMAVMVRAGMFNETSWMIRFCPYQTLRPDTSKATSGAAAASACARAGGGGRRWLGRGRGVLDFFHA